MSSTIKNLHDVEEVAPRFGFDSIQAVRFAADPRERSRHGPTGSSCWLSDRTTTGVERSWTKFSGNADRTRQAGRLLLNV